MNVQLDLSTLVMTGLTGLFVLTYALIRRSVNDFKQLLESVRTDVKSIVEDRLPEAEKRIALLEQRMDALEKRAA